MWNYLFMIDLFLWIAFKHVKGPRNDVLILNFSSKKSFYWKQMKNSVFEFSTSYKIGPKLLFDFSKENHNSKHQVGQFSFSYQVITSWCIFCFNSAIYTRKIHFDNVLEFLDLPRGARNFHCQNFGLLRKF